MKRVVLITAVAVVAVFATTLTGCEALLALFMTPTPATPVEQVDGFIAAANADTRDYDVLKAFFDPVAADYPSMQLDTYWENDLRFFSQVDQPFAIINAQLGAADPGFENSVTVTGSVTNAINTTDGYPAVFVLTTDPDDESADPLIRKITVTVVDIPLIIEKVIP